MPTLASALGIDGGAMFQIVAVENLGLDPWAIGIAFGMGVLSVPVQLVAARLPLWRARTHLQIFLMVAAVQCWVLALLVALDVAGEPVALVALAMTVVAEVSLSVLYAPAWQPLLKYALSSTQRQVVNSRGRASGGVLVAATVMVFGASSAALRTLLLVLVGVIAVLLAITTRRLPAPQPAEPGVRATSSRRGPPLPASVRWIYLVLAVAGLTATWPLFVVYASDVLWPAANLGLLGAVQLAGALLAAATWRSTDADLAPRASRASCLLVAATVALAVVRAPVTNRAEEVATLLALATAAGATATILMALLERAHRAVDNHTSVKALTVLDVVASTSLQVGLLVSGFLVSASAHRVEWLVDPYRLYLLAGTIVIALALAAAPFGVAMPKERYEPLA